MPSVASDSSTKWVLGPGLKASCIAAVRRHCWWERLSYSLWMLKSTKQWGTTLVAEHSNNIRLGPDLHLLLFSLPVSPAVWQYQFLWVKMLWVSEPHSDHLFFGFPSSSHDLITLYRESSQLFVVLMPVLFSGVFISSLCVACVYGLVLKYCCINLMARKPNKIEKLQRQLAIDRILWRNWRRIFSDTWKFRWRISDGCLHLNNMWNSSSALRILQLKVNNVLWR